jgi:hypothetical protein
LPGELRNKIYAYVFQSQPSPSPLWTNWLPYFAEVRLWKTREVAISSGRLHRHLLRLEIDCYIALTQTCRQIRAETQLLPYKYAEYNKTDKHFVRWLEILDGEAFQLVWKVLAEEQRKEVLELTMYP